jgi:hypothetical protein
VEFSPERQGAGKWLRARSIEEVEIGDSPHAGADGGTTKDENVSD